MKKITIFLLFLMVLVKANATYYSFNCMADKCNFEYSGMCVWVTPGIRIEGGDKLNAGLRLEADFSTAEKPINEVILSLGLSILNTYYPAFELTENNGSLELTRKVRVGSLNTNFTQACWTPDLLKPLRNYHIIFEIDETRCRILLSERGSESNAQCEYTFYGLMGSAAKELLGKSMTYAEGEISLSTNDNYKIQLISIKDLGYGVGVQVPEPPTQKSWLKLTNVNSGMNFSLHDNGTYEGISIVQRDKETKGCASIWEMAPLYMPTRLPTGYTVKLYNMLTSYAAAIKECLQREYDPLVNTTTKDCDTWLFYNPLDRKNKFNLSNRQYGLFAVVKDASIYDSATIWTSYTAEQTNSQWQIEKVEFNQPQIEDGFYTFRNGYSLHYLVPRYQYYSDDHALIQNNDPFQDRVWYIHKEESGLVTIQNVDTKEYVVTYNAELENRAPVVEWETAKSGNAKWIVLKRGVYYQFKNLNSNAIMQPDPNFPARQKAEILQDTESTEPSTWKLTPFSFGPSDKLGGVYRFKNMATGQYLGVIDNSKKEGATIVSRNSPGELSDWWTIISQETGGIAIQNVNSQLYLDIDNASIQTGAKGIQSSRESDKRGHSLWILEPQGSANLYKIKNVHSGLYLMFNLPSTPGEENKPVLQDENRPESIWALEPINH